MANVVVVGSQWGDEGKGKIVDWLSERADIVVRFQGGHNAGHTLVVDGTTYKLSLLPSGVVRKGKLSVIGNGVVIDPWALAEEIAKIGKLGVSIGRDNLRIAENATLILPLHRELDALREASAGDGRIGTTKRGIGPAYEDKVGRRAIRVMDLQDLPSLKPKIERILAHHNPLRRGLGEPEISADDLCAQLTEIAPKILPYVDTVWALLDAERRQGKRILFEGALCLIGNGVVLSPAALQKEIGELEATGVEVRSRLKISPATPLIMPYHIALDQAREKAAGGKAIGTTGRGIGPA